MSITEQLIIAGIIGAILFALRFIKFGKKTKIPTEDKQQEAVSEESEVESEGEGEKTEEKKEETEKSPEKKRKRIWNENQVIYHYKALREEIPLTIGDVCRGTMIFGEPGSGKTSGAGDALVRAMLEAGFGGLVLCAKDSEASRWERLAKAVGRGADLVVFSPKNKWRYNYLDEVMRKLGQNVVAETLTQLTQAIRKASPSGEIWGQAAEQLLINIVLLHWLAGKPIALTSIYKATIDFLHVDALFEVAKSRVSELTTRGKADLQTVELYLTGEYRMLAEETRSSIRLNLSTVLSQFLLGDINDLFCTTTNITPEAARKEGKIIVIDLSFDEFNKQGIVANVIWKFCFQQAMLHLGDAGPEDRPVFIFGDEYQNFVTQYDTEFLAMSRSKKVATICLSQNIVGLQNACGPHGRAAVDALMGNSITKIFCQNSCDKTYKFTTEVIGTKLQKRSGESANFGQHGAGAGGGGANVSLQRDVQVNAGDLQAMAHGRAYNRFTVTGILHFSGRKFKGQTKVPRTWTVVSFVQPKQKI